MLPLPRHIRKRPEMEFQIRDSSLVRRRPLYRHNRALDQCNHHSIWHSNSCRCYSTCSRLQISQPNSRVCSISWPINTSWCNSTNSNWELNNNNNNNSCGLPVQPVLILIHRLPLPPISIQVIEPLNRERHLNRVLLMMEIFHQLLANRLAPKRQLVCHSSRLLVTHLSSHSSIRRPASKLALLKYHRPLINRKWVSFIRFFLPSQSDPKPRSCRPWYFG